MSNEKNCWEFLKCGREIGGIKIKEMGVCVASPARGRDCWKVASTFCGGNVQGTEAQNFLIQYPVSLMK